MLGNLRLAGLQLALAAMVLRALLPAGWMPDTTATAGVAIAICSADGPVSLQVATADGAGKHDLGGGDAHHVDVCPFATAQHAATFAPFVADLLPAAIAVLAPPALQPRNVAGSPVYTPQSPRAPPFPV
ncbi:MAG: DUF2946 family protein [Rhizomicrobium sp.]